MTSWVYIFSQFTPEALLFEALILFILCCGYTAFWVLRKRRYGVIDTEVPSGPVKSYLNELIDHAEQLRLQLFGLLASRDAHGNLTLNGSSLAGLSASDPETQKKLAALEAKMAEQAKAFEAIHSEKMQLEKDLASAKASALASAGSPPAGGSAADPSQSAAVGQLQQKVSELEGKLAEYNVIEDDLANLKRLQQENAQLKAQLSGKGLSLVPPPAAAPTPPAPAQAPAAAAPTPAAAPAPTDAFAGLVAPVQTSLQAVPSPPAEETASPIATAPPPTADPNLASTVTDATTPVKSESEKAEADLVAEFEKMLKG